MTDPVTSTRASATRLLDICARVGRHDLIERLQPAVTALDRDTMTVVVAGEGQRGKSTLVNALLGEAVVPEGTERLLLRTGGSIAGGAFPDDWPALTAGCARALVGRGLRLLGVDAPSVDRRESTTLDTHHALFEGGAGVLENLDLRPAPDGRYLLHAYPLRWEGLERVAYVKIDAEGAEEDILDGAARTIARSRPIVQLELSVRAFRPALPDYTGFRAAGSPNAVYVPNEHAKRDIPERLGWSRIGAA